MAHDRRLRIALAVLAALAAAPAVASAHVTRIEITQIESPAFGGAAFGDTGAYEKLTGRAFGEVDPRDPANAEITDLRRAPRNARGMVEYDTGLVILRPIDPARGNHRLFYELTNRGVILTLRAINESSNPLTTDPGAADAGNGFLMREGYTLLFTGWDVSAVGPFASHYPIAVQRNGAPIVGPALEELVFDSAPASAALSYPAATLDPAAATLTVRTHYDDPQTAIPSTAWRFVDARTIQLLPEGARFEPGRLYELAYPATAPSVAGLALAAVRDIPTFLHHARGAGNPLAGQIAFTIAIGISQPARLLHDFVALGFNRDDHGRRVFDGVLAYIAGGSGGFFNVRFAQPFRTHRQHIGRWTPERGFPFADPLLFDPVTGTLGGRLVRCTLTATCPRIFEVNSSNEYWVKAGSLLHTDTRGHDLLFDPPGVRSYLFAGMPHSPAAGPGICEQERNPLAPSAGLRALIVDLDAWLSRGTPPPASRLPRRSDGTLVPPLPQAGVGFPVIPGVRYTGAHTTGDRFDFGPRFDDGVLDIRVHDGVIVPPVVASPYPVFVPATDADGNERAGVRLPDIAVPLATYTGYGFRAAALGGPDLCDAFGQALAFPRTRADRLATGDPRASIEERYPVHAAYVAQVRAAAEALAGDRLLLAEDVERFVQAADARPIGQ